MEPKKWHIRLDMQKQYDNELITMIRQDTYSNVLNITLLSNGSLVDFSDVAMVGIIFDKSDGTRVVGSCTVIGKGLLRYKVDYQAITALGITNVTLKLIDGSMIETSMSFIINVIEDPFSGTDGDVTSTSEYPILTQMIIDSQAINTILQGWIDDPTQFTGPQGPQGIQGEQGIQGPQGIPGAIASDTAPTNPDTILWLNTADTSPIISKADVGLGNVLNVEQVSKVEFDSLKNDFVGHKLDYMPHRIQDLKNNKVYNFGLQVSAEGNPRIIFKEVI